METFNRCAFKVAAIIIILLNSAIFAANPNIANYLQRAQTQYQTGDLRGSLNAVNEAKKLLEDELSATNRNAYALINDWDEVLLNKRRLLGSRIKITTQFTTVGSDGAIWLSAVNNWCTIDPILTDRVLSLEKYKKYTFSGILKEDNDFIGPYLHVEKIDAIE